MGRRDLEFLECKKLIQWRDANKLLYPALGLLIHIPNEGARSCAAGVKLGQAGLTKGAPDFVLLKALEGGQGILAIEMKTATGVQSREQRSFELLLGSQGGTYKLCRSAIEAVNIIKSVLRM